MNYQERLLRAIPGGAHTYSRGFDQYPANAPHILKGGKGVETFDLEGNRFLDYGMALRAVNIGYAEEEIDNAAIEQIRLGNNLTRPSFIELEAAELLIGLIDSVEMVKFTKNGSSSVSAAVKLSRAYTGRDLVARCAQHPFFSYDDWFIGSTHIKRGIPEGVLAQTKIFQYNNLRSLEDLIAEFPDQIACVVMEPANTECPCIVGKSNLIDDMSKCEASSRCVRGNFLLQVQELCKKNGIVFVIDEMITGFRWDLGGAQNRFGINPDLSTFGKAMANGYSVSCVAGKREIMELGSIEKVGEERVFLLSTTHGAEMSSLGAFIKTVEFMQKYNVIDHIWQYGQKLMQMMNATADSVGISRYFHVSGPACSPFYTTSDLNGNASLEFRTLFSQEMIKQGVLMPWIAIAYRHDEQTLSRTIYALEKTLAVYKKALEGRIENFLVGPSIKPVFRKYN
jgi:glutamate-1-semialdehyde 2,1-aminomutase